jgi:hypothetical protein
VLARADEVIEWNVWHLPVKSGSKRRRTVQPEPFRRDANRGRISSGYLKAQKPDIGTSIFRRPQSGEGSRKLSERPDIGVESS